MDELTRIIKSIWERNTGCVNPDLNLYTARGIAKEITTLIIIGCSGGWSEEFLHNWFRLTDSAREKLVRDTMGENAEALKEVLNG